jgi:hypothetical protein
VLRLPHAPYAATFVFLYPVNDDLSDLNIQGHAASRSDVFVSPWPGDAWQQHMGYDQDLGKNYFGWQAISAAPQPQGFDDGLDAGAWSTGGEAQPGGALFEIVSFNRAPAEGEVKISEVDEATGMGEDPMILGALPGPGPISVGSKFSFQGRLTDAGQPAQGEYDLKFELYDDPNTGNQLGPTNLKDDQPLTDGFFATTLDFGKDVFTGEARWLEIAIRAGASSDPNDFVILIPRQQILPTTYAMYADTAAGPADGHSLDAADGDPEDVVYVNDAGNVRMGLAATPAQLTLHGELQVGAPAPGGDCYDVNIYGNTGVGKLFFDESKVALRVGSASGNQWDDANVGWGSVALGGDTKASGDSAVAMGRNTEANGNQSLAGGANSVTNNDFSLAMGDTTTAGGYASQAFGGYSIAAGDRATALGYSTQANGNNSLATGNDTIAGGHDSFAMGYMTTAGGNRSAAFGSETTASSWYSVAMGQKTTASASGAVAMGYNFTNSNSYSLGIGYGDMDILFDPFSGISYIKGYLAVGKDSPADTLDVNGDIRVRGADIKDDGGTSRITLTDNGNLDLKEDGGSVALRIDTDGEVGIGVTAPAYKLDVDGDVRANNLRLNAVVGEIIDKGGMHRIDITDNGTLDLREDDGILALRIDTSGNVGIKTTPVEELTVNGHIWCAMNGTSSGAPVRWYNNVLYYDTSSARYKQDIQPLEDDYEKILQAEPKSYVDKTSGNREIGFVAEQFDSLGLQNLVTYKDGQPESLKYDRVSLYLLEVLKEQAQSIRDLKAQNRQLQQSLEMLKKNMTLMQERAPLPE